MRWERPYLNLTVCLYMAHGSGNIPIVTSKLHQDTTAIKSAWDHKQNREGIRAPVSKSNLCPNQGLAQITLRSVGFCFVFVKRQSLGNQDCLHFPICGSLLTTPFLFHLLASSFQLPARQGRMAFCSMQVGRAECTQESPHPESQLELELILWKQLCYLFPPPADLCN